MLTLVQLRPDTCPHEKSNWAVLKKNSCSLLFMTPFLKERTFSLSAWLCGQYRLSVLCIMAVMYSFLSDQLVWFSSCKLFAFRISFPQESFVLFKFTVPFQTDNFWNVRIFDCRIRICPASPSRDVKQGLCFFLLHPAWNGGSAHTAGSKSPVEGTDPLLLTEQLLYSSSSSCQLKSASGAVSLRFKTTGNVRTWEKCPTPD